MVVCAVLLCRFYQELDFPWSLDPELVLQLVPRVVDIVSQEVAKVYDDQMPPGVTPQVHDLRNTLNELCDHRTV